MGERGWARRLLTWNWRGVQLEAELARARYFVRAAPGEVLAWCEVRDLSGRRRIEVGAFRSVGEARGACELDAERRCRRAAEDRPAPDVRISPGRRRGAGREANKGRELLG